MKLSFCIIILSMVLINCSKENAKKLYSFKLEFPNNENIETDVYLLEKPKNYNSNYTKTFFKDNEAIVIQPSNTSKGLLTEMVCFKTKEKKLIAIDKAEMSVTDLQITNLVEGTMIGVLDLDTKYKSPFRKITVDNGTFSFTWSNAEDFGLQDTVLTGTWSLKRK